MPVKIMCALIPVVKCSLYCTRPSPAASDHPRLPCIVSNKPLAWRPMCNFGSRKAIRLRLINRRVGLRYLRPLHQLLRKLADECFAIVRLERDRTPVSGDIDIYQMITGFLR